MALSRGLYPWCCLKSQAQVRSPRRAGTRQRSQGTGASGWWLLPQVHTCRPGNVCSCLSFLSGHCLDPEMTTAQMTTVDRKEAAGPGFRVGLLGGLAGWLALLECFYGTAESSRDHSQVLIRSYPGLPSTTDPSRSRLSDGRVSPGTKRESRVRMKTGPRVSRGNALFSTASTRELPRECLHVQLRVYHTETLALSLTHDSCHNGT